MKKGVQRYYQKRAETYEDLDEPETIVAAVRAIGIADHLRIMDLGKEELVLDVGCGTGRFLQPFSSRARAVGVDFTVEMLEKAGESGALLVRADAEHLPFKDRVFDVVHSAGLLGVYRSQRICHEMVRVAGKGGRVYVSFPASESASGVVARLFMRLGWNPTLLDHWYSKADIRGMLPVEAEITGIYRLGFEPPFQRLYRHLRSRLLTRLFIALERRLRDRPLLRYFGARWLVEAKRG